jgi:hypothetical protein
MAPIATAVAEFIEFFERELTEVSFPEVDSPHFAALVDEVRDRAADVERAKEQLEAARAALDASQQTLRQRAERGLAYARVFAEGNEELFHQLQTLQLSRSQAKKPARRRRAKGNGKGSQKPASAKGDQSSPPTPVLPFGDVRHESDARANVA